MEHPQIVILVTEKSVVSVDKFSNVGMHDMYNVKKGKSSIYTHPHTIGGSMN